VLETDAKQVIRFGTFEVDSRAGELRRDGSRVKLQDQPFQVLLALLAKPGDVVTREELRAKLWPADTFVDFDHGLNAAVKRLRDALGDTAENPRFIETLAKRGYRFLVPLQGQAVTPSPAVPTPVLPAPTTVPVAKRRTLVIGGLISLFLAVTFLWWLVAHRVSPKAHPTEQRLTANPPDIPIRWAALSPDGKYLAYWDRTGLFLKLISTGETHALNLPNEFTEPPFRYFSVVVSAGRFPDSSALLLTPAGQPESIWSVSVLGGSPKKVMEDGEARAVSPAGSQIAFMRGAELPQSLWVMDADGSHARKLIGQAGDLFDMVTWSPDNHKLAFVLGRPGVVPAKTELGTYDFGTGATNSILYDPGLFSVAWTRDNRLIYSLREHGPNSADSNLWAIPVDPRTGAVRGPAQKLTDGPDGKDLISVSDSGRVLTYARVSIHRHMYVVKVPRKGETNEAPSRMKLDEGNNAPYTWMPDGESVIFVSDRGGARHLYKQGAHQLTPDLLVGGDEEVGIVRISPDRSEILYELAPANGTQGGAPTRILAIAVNGGSPREVLRSNGIYDFQCTRAPANVCIMSQTTEETTHISTFDPPTGVVAPVLTIQPGADFAKSFSPDGTTLAVAPDFGARIPGEIQLYNLRDASHITLKVNGWGLGYGMDWNPDGKSLWVHARTLKGAEAIVNVDLQGNVTPLFEDTEKRVGWAIPSPDGSRVAYYKLSCSSNVWVLRDF
jgi:DNA-binding winged helix-turn-helix (wHTH) protein/Tol biopolymer transport system component